MFLITFLAPPSLSTRQQQHTKEVVKLHIFAVSNPSLFVATAEKSSHALGHRL